MTEAALLQQAQDGSPSTATRSYKGTGLAKLGGQMKQDVLALLGLVVEVVGVHGAGTRRSCGSCASSPR